MSEQSSTILELEQQVQELQQRVKNLESAVYISSNMNYSVSFENNTHFKNENCYFYEDSMNKL